MGGAEKNCVVVCNEFVKSGIDVELWVARLEDTPIITLLDKRVKLFSIPGKRIRYVFFQLKKRMVGCKSKPILVFNVELLIFAFIINKIFRLHIKLVARSINTLSQSYNDGQGIIGKIIWSALTRYSFKRIESIIAQSVGMKDDLVGNFKIPESKIIVIPNPAHNLVFNENANKEIIYSKEILFAGRITVSKGLFYLLDSFQIALKYIPDLHLTIVGEGEFMPELQKRIDDLDLSNAITLEGYQTDMLPYYCRAKATVLTSLYEGFPNVLVESISVGTPVISFDCPSGPKDIIVPDVNGILVEYLNVSDFANAIVEIIDNHTKFEKQKIIESANKFNLKSIIEQYKYVIFDK